MITFWKWEKSNMNEENPFSTGFTHNRFTKRDLQITVNFRTPRDAQVRRDSPRYALGRIGTLEHASERSSTRQNANLLNLFLSWDIYITEVDCQCQSNIKKRLEWLCHKTNLWTSTFHCQNNLKKPGSCSKVKFWPVTQNT